MQLIVASLIAVVAFYLVGALLLTVARAFDLCGRDSDCVTAFIDGAFEGWQAIAIVGFIVTAIEIFTSPELTNPLEGVMWLVFTALYAWFMIESVIVPGLSAVLTGWMRGAAIMGAIAAAQYAWNKFMKWGIAGTPGFWPPSRDSRR